MRRDPVPFSDRVGRLRSGFAETEALLILNGKNIRYLTGFTGGEGALMAGPDWLTLLVDGRFITQAQAEVRGAEIFEFKKRADGIAAVARRRGVRSIGFESSVLTVAEHLRLKETLPDVSYQPLDGAFDLLRAVKDSGEIECIREAARIAAEAFGAVLGMIRPGVSEKEIALELEYRMRRGGAEQASFDTIVATGANSALPHATPGDRTIADGDCLKIDYGAVFGGYHSDETCTLLVGHASERQREVYRYVLEAHDRAIRTIRAGISCEEIDRIARSYLNEAGIGDFFPHSTGHGVGLDVHESPRLAAGRDELLQAGMVVTVEPGAYFPGLWGIRIEDTVLVTQKGCEILTPTPKDLIEI
jgi:Xaa-Pro aminopeptidase